MRGSIPPRRIMAGVWDSFYIPKRNPWVRDSHDCKVGALAAGVKILLHVGTGQCEGEVGKAAGSGVRAIWGGRCGGAEGGCNEDDGEGCSCGDLHGT